MSTLIIAGSPRMDGSMLLKVESAIASISSRDVESGRKCLYMR
jgi:hypothetical protein